MTIFRAAQAAAATVIETIFGDRAIHRTKDFVLTPCVVIVSAADQIETIGSTQIVAGQYIIEVRSSQISEPRKGDTFEIFGREFVIVAAPRRLDPDRCIWRCLCDLERALNR